MTCCDTCLFVSYEQRVNYRHWDINVYSKQCLLPSLWCPVSHSQSWTLALEDSLNLIGIFWIRFMFAMLVSIDMVLIRLFVYGKRWVWHRESYSLNLSIWVSIEITSQYCKSLDEPDGLGGHGGQKVINTLICLFSPNGVWDLLWSLK